MPVKVTPKDFFLWFGAMVALLGSVISFIALLFSYIDHVFPDPLAYYADPYSGGMRFAMATLIVLVPVLIILMRFIRQDIAAEPAKGDLWVRRWALFLTLFLAGGAIVIDLITLINHFLGGELTTPFVFKVLVVLFVTGGVFLHFMADMRGYWNANQGQAKMVGYAVAVLVLLSIIAGFFIMGTPGEVRLYRYDDQKVSDLQSIQWQIVNYWQQKGEIPEDSAALEDPISGFRLPGDPQPPLAYMYRKTGPLSFELCATFNRESRASRAQPARPGMEENWQHPAGEHCFERTIDPDRYPLFEKPTPSPVRPL
ncbi:hypothetical protein COU20_03860 [Candidatus Kaiserbacteria bacterium CG10_big_fil_rev_8_21_14_0_10_59_10]|uniref:DUF5671 domain-containing protein n=1 Tax=Candidatus Kaiserbacteria bacterium CG10_big_fil_rev_8_21_14_0_10_59_10 TaxID=1974612 RepID=A0A2H0U774_9BACT|nr:MAG: hypothetical protein COU20_03860 [Candidatus Kaiserbacteria bacterium CG10_big_fil_rev_8_21_14_0_10_59_10]